FYLNGMTFRLNWDTGEGTLVSIHHRLSDAELQLVPRPPSSERTPPFQEPGSRHKKFGASENPNLPLYLGGHKYFTNAYNTDPTTGPPLAGLWIDREGIAVPVAAAGSANDWPLLKTPAFRSRLPAADLRDGDLSKFFFVWSDLNGDHAVEPS